MNNCKLLALSKPRLHHPIASAIAITIPQNALHISSYRSQPHSKAANRYTRFSVLNHHCSTAMLAEIYNRYLSGSSPVLSHADHAFANRDWLILSNESVSVQYIPYRLGRYNSQRARLYHAIDASKSQLSVSIRSGVVLQSLIS